MLSGPCPPNWDSIRAEVKNDGLTRISSHYLGNIFSVGYWEAKPGELHPSPRLRKKEKSFRMVRVMCLLKNG